MSKEIQLIADDPGMFRDLPEEHVRSAIEQACDREGATVDGIRFSEDRVTVSVEAPDGEFASRLLAHSQVFYRDEQTNIRATEGRLSWSQALEGSVLQ